MKGTTTGADILKALLHCTNSMNLDLSKLVLLTTDGAPAMISNNKGAVVLLQNLEDLGREDKITKVHCLIHQEALCAKTTNLKSIMDTLVKAVNMILSHKLNHRQFRQLLQEAENQDGDILYFCDVRWLSRGAMHARVYELRNEIGTFLENKNINATEICNPERVSNLAFLVDLTSDLIKLNLQLQGKNQLIHEMWRYVLKFETKLRLRECQLEKENYVHFPTLEERKPTSNTAFLTVIRNLRTDFSSRFSNICSLRNKFKLFSTSFDVDVNDIPKKFQIDFIEMQCRDELKQNFIQWAYRCLTFTKSTFLKVVFIPACPII